MSRLLSWVEPENFNPGYLLRGEHRLPRRGEAAEWRHTQDYWAEKDEIPAIDLAGAEFVYDGERHAARTRAAAEPITA